MSNSQGFSGKVTRLKVTNSVMCNVWKREFLSAFGCSVRFSGRARSWCTVPPPSQSSELFDHST